MGLVLIGASSAAALEFTLGKTLLGQNILAKALPRKYLHFTRQFQKNRWQWVLLIRMVPMLPFGLSHYLCGLSGVSLLTYLVVNVVTMLPVTIVQVMVGVSGTQALHNHSPSKGISTIAYGLLAWLLAQGGKRLWDRWMGETVSQPNF